MFRKLTTLLLSAGLTALLGAGCSSVQDFTIEKVFDVNDLISEDIEVVGSSQGFAMYDGLGFFFHDNGQVLIIDMERDSLVSTFVVPGLEAAHCNNAGFSDEKYTDESVFPLLYVTECKENNKCFVVDLNYETGTVVQEIRYDGDDYNRNFDWCIDPQAGYIYTRGGNHDYWVDTPTHPDRGRWMMVKRFPLPRKADFTESGEIRFTPEDALDSFAVDDVYFGQGSVIRDGIMYTGEGAPSACHCRIHVINLDTHERLAIHDVSDLGLEPEGFDILDGWVYVTFHTPHQPRHNVLYRFKI